MRLNKTALGMLLAVVVIGLGSCGDQQSPMQPVDAVDVTTENDGQIDPSQPAVLEIQLILSNAERKLSRVKVDIQWDDGGIPSNTSATSNQDGLVRVEFEHGSQLLSVRANPGSYSAPGSIENPKVLFGGKTHHIEMVLAPASAVFGTVYDVEGVPVVGAQVACYFCTPQYLDSREQTQVDVFTTTDENGKFALGGIPAGAFILDCAFEDQMSVWRPGGVVKEGEAYRDLEIFLEPAHPVYGQAIDKNEDPIAGADIVAGKPNRRKNRKTTNYPTVFLYGPRAVVTRSAKDGTFILPSVPESQGWNVKARHPDYALTHVVVDAGQIDVWVEMDATISLTGLVSDTAGNALKNTQLWLLTYEGDVSAGSDAYGNYKFSDLRDVDDVYLIAHHPQHGTALAGPVVFEGKSQVVNVRLLAAQTISGKVVNALGEPQSNVGVQIKGALPRANFSESRLPERFLGIDSSLTNSQGEFSFDNLYANDFEVMVYPVGKPAVFKQGVHVGDVLEIVIEDK